VLRAVTWTAIRGYITIIEGCKGSVEEFPPGLQQMKEEIARNSFNAYRIEEAGRFRAVRSAPRSRN
jgi:hypothetical protein